MDNYSHRIGFATRGASLSLDATLGEQPIRRVHLGLQLEPDEDVQLPDGRSLRHANWSLAVHESTQGHLESNELAIGQFKYWSAHDGSNEPEECTVSAILLPNAFDALISAMQSGRMPNHVDICVRGLKFGLDPNGSAKVWDAKSQSLLPVMQLSFRMPLTITGVADDSLGDADAAIFPASRTDIRSLEQQVVLLRRSVITAAVTLGAFALLLWWLR
jgi:hypothetical protein